ncbi:MAG: hypothetical protein U9R05_01450 [Chloroflexota bacterium]|nr:hypothetical protein [Chloroflexota bacterium]
MGEPDDMPVEDLMRLLDTDPTAFDRLIVPRLHKQYQQALEALCVVMQNPKRERKAVREHITAWLTSGQPAPQHIPTLAELERVTRKRGGAAYVQVEQRVFEEMARLNHPDLVPFLLEAFRYRRKRDQFSRRRREYTVDIVSVIAARTRNSAAVAALVEMTADPKPEIRGIALHVIYKAFEREGVDMLPAVLDLFWKLGQEDPDYRVRQTALAWLQKMGQISYEEALGYLNKS